MKTNLTKLSTGMAGLDRVLQGLQPGDNVVWEVDGIEDYLPVLGPLCQEAGRLKRKLIYFRFASHAPLLTDEGGAQIYQLNPEEGFERFLTEILDVIERAGPGAYYIFDCLSDLAAGWFSDRMLGNFFMIACPYLYELETITYFALQKNVHSFHATQPIFNTAQVIIEVYRKENSLFIHPMKVWQRYTPTMYMLHSWEGEDFKPVTNSATITDILASVPKPWLEFTIHRPGVWVRTFQQAQDTVKALPAGPAPDEDPKALFQRLMKMLLTRDERMATLAATYLDLGDLVEIMERMVGTGQIGGKSLGMLLGRAILKRADKKWRCLLESHDSFYVGSDVFYTYLVQNGCWWLRRRQKDFNLYLQRAEEARQKILQGVFPDYIQQQFMEMLEYFGQSPLIVRSSSLLEDNYGNAFSGKYESVFLANQGAPPERLQNFMRAVRTVYASAMSEEGLSYRLHHGLLDRDEQMALLVQRVSGELHGSLFFPQTAGVGFSFNPFVWNDDIDPQAGMLRLVFGLGTRAVDRTDDDYARLVSLNAPLRQPEARPDRARQFAQRRVDVLDLNANQLVSREFELVAQSFPSHLIDFFAARDEQIPAHALNKDQANAFFGYVTFERLLAETAFVPAMRELCDVLQRAYNYPVDIEFTANFTPGGGFRINLLQCRPFQVKIGGEGSRVKVPDKIEPDRLLLQSSGPMVGHGLATTIDRLIYVVPSVYSQMSPTLRYSVARTIGRLTHLDGPEKRATIMLIGPGRWGTSMPSLGVPVSFAEINTVSVICELALMHEGLIPDVSLGTHFFNDLVEMDMLYLAVSPGREGHCLNEPSVLQRPNQLGRLIPAAQGLSEALRVIDSSSQPGADTLFLNVDSMKQRGVCYWGTKS
ncbi:MAG: pyruvate, phosphate dikinase [Verrucomicrobia bacterium]|nr:pyruvate, phosphate dikinase [Verrucomicrobiota bacterium]